MLVAGAAGVAAGVVALTVPAEAGKASSAYYGRWTVDEEKPIFTERGRAYKTLDIAPCGKDFCGVSVDDNGKCGQVMFRFLGSHANTETLRGHGRWGAERKNVVIYSYGTGGVPGFELYLGDGANMGGRSGSMPKFHTQYRKLGNARCTAK